MVSSPHGSPIVLVSADIRFIAKFEGSHPKRGRWMRVGWVRIGDFRPLIRRISETVDTTMVNLWITNRKSNTCFRLVPKSTTLVDPEMTLDGNYALCCNLPILWLTADYYILSWCTRWVKNAYVCCMPKFIKIRYNLANLLANCKGSLNGSLFWDSA